MNELEPNREYPFPVVGIGASAGGLVALEAFFKNTPADTGMAFVVVQHLSHEFKSLMDSLLARYTDMPINIIEDGMRIQPNHIYLIPSGTFLSIKNLRFSLTEYNADKVILRYPINQFFTSLANDAKSRAIGVILSGAGSDGSIGIRDIHESGGLVIVQDVESARFDGMPQAAAETGLADIIIAPDKICRAILAFLDGHLLEVDDEQISDQIVTAENAFSFILSLLHKRFKVNFNFYKMPTLIRRIERRMQIANVEHVEEYVNFLNENINELNHLYRDMLVDVTRFFRDPEAYELIQDDIIPKIIESKKDGETIRLWIAGCATGEEAYSITMLFQHLIEESSRMLELKVFATDLHEDSIRRATVGTFDPKSAEDIPEPFFDKYFYEENGRLYIEREIRQKIIFAPHDLLKDSPFTNLDMITCRNVLIYMIPNAQQKVLQQFHFGLNKNGYLFLGPSEYLGSLSNDFTTLNRMWRIYSKNSNRRVLDVSAINLTRSNTIRTGKSKYYSSVHEGWELPLISKYLPDSILVDQQWYLIRTFGHGVRYLKLPTGRVDLLITRLIHAELVTPLRAALYKAGQEKRATLLERIVIAVKEKETVIELGVVPIFETEVEENSDEDRKDINFYLITINEIHKGHEATANMMPIDHTQFVLDSQEMKYVEELERELSFTRESLQATIEELETTNEELQSSNEELLAANEELQSTNEELHSVNEELYTVNSEYILQNEQLAKLHEDVQNLQRNLHTISIVVNSQFKIIDFTPDAGDLFGLLPHDNGRPLDNLLLFENVSNKVLQKLVEESLNGYSHHLHILQKGTPYLLQIVPHHDMDSEEIGGAILKLSDASELLGRETIMTGSSVGTNSISRINPVMIFIYDIEAQAMVFVNWAVYELLGKIPEAITSLPENEFLTQHVHPDDHEEMKRKIIDLDEAPDGTIVKERVRMKNADGEWRWIESKKAAFSRGANGKLTQYIASAVDVSDFVSQEQLINSLEDELASLRSQMDKQKK